MTGAAAAVLDSGYLGLIYEIQDLSLGGARLKGKRRPPDNKSFEILLHISNRFLERRARQVWFDDQEEIGILGIEFEGVDVRDTIDWVEPQEEENARCATWASAPLNRSLRSIKATIESLGKSYGSLASSNPLVGGRYALP